MIVDYCPVKLRFFYSSERLAKLNAGFFLGDPISFANIIHVTDKCFLHRKSLESRGGDLNSRNPVSTFLPLLGKNCLQPDT